MEEPVNNYLTEPEDYLNKLWGQMQTVFEGLLAAELNCVTEFKKWLLKRSLLETIFEEEEKMRLENLRIRKYSSRSQQAYNYFLEIISPKLHSIKQQLNEKLITALLLPVNNKSEDLLTGLSSNFAASEKIKMQLLTRGELLQQKYTTATAEMMLTISGKEYAVMQATNFLIDASTGKEIRTYYFIIKENFGDKEMIGLRCW